MKTEVDFDASELEGAVEAYAKKVGDLDRLAPTVAEILREAVDYVFDTEGDGSWKPSARAILQGGKTLQDTGNLAGTIEADATFVGNEIVAFVGSDVPYAPYHLPPEKSGHPVVTGVMPVRDFLDIDADDVMDEIGDLFVGFVTDVT